MEDGSPMYKSVLLVDTSEDLRSLYQKELQAEGYRVLTAYDGTEAVQALEKSRVDLVYLHLTDTGDEALDKLSQIARHVENLKIVISTDFSGFHLDFRTWVADACVLRSADLSELKNTIRKLLHNPTTLRKNLN
ncbi:response regulator [bacterium]|nr:response regulator [bacterium]